MSSRKNSNSIFPGVRRRRRGVIIVVVLALVSITLALSYAMIRSQTTAIAIQSNLNSKGNARHAAVTGMIVALRKMHKSSWTGVDTSASGVISDTESYQVTYKTGDPLLNSTDPDYVDYPYRVTLTSTGYSSNPSQPSQVATHVVQTVVQLIPRKFSDEPANWDDVRQYTVYQWADKNVEVHLPVRVEGPVYLQGKLNLCTSYPPSGGPLETFLEDLEKMRVAGLGDSRPFGGPVNLPFSRSDVSTLSLLQNELNVVASNVPKSDMAPLSFPASISSYQLYPGGKSYSFQSLSSSLANETLEPDPLTNPLGIYLRKGRLDLLENVTIQGTVITSGRGGAVVIRGTNVNFKPFDLRPIEGSTATVQLPAVISKEDIRIEDFSSGSLRGMALCWRNFEFSRGDAGVSFSVKGRIVAKELKLQKRTQWDAYSNGDWTSTLNAFESQRDNLIGAIKYFPEWIKNSFGLDWKPLLTIKPNSSGVTYHWQDFSQPIYEPPAGDEGLWWELLRWVDSP